MSHVCDFPSDISNEEDGCESEDYETDSQDEDQEEAEAMRPRAFTLDPSQLSNNGSLPINGHDYLQFVQKEREKYPEVSFTTKEAINKKNPHLRAKTLEASTTRTTPNGFTTIAHNCDRHDLLYKDQILAKFVKLRKHIESVRKVFEVGSTAPEKIPEDQWERYMSDSRQHADKMISKIARKELPNHLYLVRRSQMDIHLTLERLAERYESTKVVDLALDSDWIYSLMAFLQEPIDADICSNLRRIGKFCIVRRNSIETENNPLESSQHPIESSTLADMEAETAEEYYGCLLIICLVRNYFKQLDLK